MSIVLDGTSGVTTPGLSSTSNATVTGTLGVTGTSTPGQTTGIVGTTTNNSAQAGSVGQYVESVVASVAYPATGDWGDATSISLTAGDWDVSISSIADSNSSTWSFAAVGISVTAGNFDTGLVFGSNWVRGAYPSSSTTPLNYPLTIPTYRQSLAGTTTIYMKIKATYSAGSPLIHGRISARRVR